MAVSVDRARAALGDIAQAARCSVEDAALGVIQVANAGMEKALRVISIERGHDPRRFTLVPFGGAGPLHACELASALGIRTVLVPPHPGVLSALGLLLARQRREQSLTVAVRCGGTTTGALEAVVERLRDGRSGSVRRWVDVRYPGQSFELSLTLSRLEPAVIAAAFHRLHQRRYGFCRPTSDVEIVNVRVSLEKPGPAGSSVLAGPVQASGPAATRAVYVDGGWQEATVASRRGLLQVSGPAVVRQYDCTVWVPPGWSGQSDRQGNLVLTA
jgi:N-methylhydantoinase A